MHALCSPPALLMLHKADNSAWRGKLALKKPLPVLRQSDRRTAGGACPLGSQRSHASRVNAVQSRMSDSNSRKGRQDRRAKAYDDRPEPQAVEDVNVAPVRDPQKDQARKYMRTLSTFTFDRWSAHRSVSRYWRHISGIFASSIVRGLWGPLAYVAGVSTLVCAYQTLRQSGALPTGAPSFILPTAPFDFTSFALSLLLVFRTNTSYDRWLEVSTTWGGIANRSRDTVRQLLAYLAAAEARAAVSASAGSATGHLISSSSTSTSIEASLAAAASSDSSTGIDSSAGSSAVTMAVVRWLVAYVRSLKAQVSEDSDLEAELVDVLHPCELRMLLDAHHGPSFALTVLTGVLEVAPLSEAQRARLDENLTYLEDAVGTCERVLRTPIPLSYTRHTSRFMVIWLTLLPLALWSSCGVGTIPLAVVISFLLLGIEEIGVQIEEPFGILPLDDLCEEIEGDLFSQLEEAPAACKAIAGAAAEAAALALAGVSGAESRPLLSAEGAETGTGAAAATPAADTPTPFARWLARQQQRMEASGSRGRSPRPEWAEAGDARAAAPRRPGTGGRGGTRGKGAQRNAPPAIIYNSIVDDSWEDESTR